MKKYFVRYLPVDGEVKEGDRWSGVSNDVRFTSPYRWNHTDDKDDLLDPEVSDVKPVKLFLCTVDIQVGDDIKKDYGGTTRDSKVFKQRNDTLVKLEGYYDWHDLSKLGEKGFYKIVGVVSPNATWVKPLDEFEEEEIKISKRCQECYFTEGAQVWCGCSNQNISFVEIKGPCGHFH